MSESPEADGDSPHLGSDGELRLDYVRPEHHSTMSAVGHTAFCVAYAFGAVLGPWVMFVNLRDVGWCGTARVGNIMGFYILGGSMSFIAATHLCVVWAKRSSVLSAVRILASLELISYCAYTTYYLWW